jgi:DNA (cytosine-5)-methyltransferase 1
MEDEALGQAPVWDNLLTFNGTPWRGVVDIIAAGIPCVSYSVAGKRRGNDDERALWPELVRVVGEVRPSMVFIENVPAFVTGGHFQPAGEELSRLGYQIEDPVFLRAEDVGAPHRRERVFILAHATGQHKRTPNAEHAAILRENPRAPALGRGV